MHVKKIMWIGQNWPLDKNFIYLYVLAFHVLQHNIWCDKKFMVYANLCLTRIIRINKTCTSKNITIWYQHCTTFVTNMLKDAEWDSKSFAHPCWYVANLLQECTLRVTTGMCTLHRDYCHLQAASTRLASCMWWCHDWSWVVAVFVIITGVLLGQERAESPITVVGKYTISPDMHVPRV